MKQVSLILLTFFFALVLKAQTTFCDTVFQIVPGSPRFMASQFSGGDSMLQVSLVNISSAQSMAYPTAKIIHLSPLPPGMTLSINSISFNTVFASSYVPGDTAQVSFYYQVTQPIPLNYSVWFELWADGDNQGSDIDSCIVRDSFQVNLNPGPTQSDTDLFSETSGWSAYSHDGIIRIKSETYTGEIQIADVLGRVYYSGHIRKQEALELSGINSGLYIIRGDRVVRILHQED